MTTDERKKMIDKIVALLALADSTTHDEEADTARNMAGRLMGKYAIDFTDIKSDEDPGYTTEDYVNINPKGHEISLENAIGKFNGVLVITVTKVDKTKYIRLVGSRDNIDAHLYMMDLVKSQRASAYNLFCANKDFLEEKITATEKTTWHNSYAYGVNNVVWDLINAGQKAQQEWGLVVIDPVKAAEDWYADQRGKQLAVSRRRKIKIGEAGLEAGRGVKLNRAVTTGNRPTIMIGE